MTRAQAIDRALPFCAIGVGIAFAIASWVVIDLWAFPALVAWQRGPFSSADPSRVVMPGLTYGSSVLSVALWPLSIALAHVLAGVLLVAVQRAPIRMRLAILTGSVGAVWLVGGTSFGPPDAMSFLAFTAPALVVLALMWLAALAIGAARARRSIK